MLKYAVPLTNESFATLNPPSVYKEAVEVKLIAFEAWFTYCGPVNTFDPVVAYCPSIKVTLPEIDPEVVANEELTTEDVTSKLVTLVERLPEVAAKEELTTEDVASKLVTLTETDAEDAANEDEADTKVLEVASKFPVLILKEADDWAYEAEVMAYDPEVTKYELLSAR